MDIEFLRKIGKRIFKEISAKRPFLNNIPLGRGASGDITFLLDKLAEDIIIEEFEKEGLNINIITEERGLKIIEGNDLTLIIDPIDGSRNAVSGIPFFSASIALADGPTLKDLRAGYIINLINSDEFWSFRNQGAFFNGEKIQTKKDDISIVIAFETANPYSSLKEMLPLFRLANRVRCFGSTALALAYLSMGSCSIFITPTPSRIFDFSAGILVAKEAGAIVTNISGNSIEKLPVQITTKTTLLVSANNDIHKKALSLINEEA